MSSKEMNLRAKAKIAEDDIRKQLHTGESLLCYCILGGGKRGVAIFMLIASVLFAAGVVGALYFEYNDRERIFYAVFMGALFVTSIYSAIHLLRVAKYQFCFITENRISFLSKAGDVRDILKDDIKKVQFVPRGSVSVGRGARNIHNFVTFATYGNYSRKKKYSIVPKFNAKEMAEALHQISEPYLFKKVK
jgi:hypothetical protein